MIKKTSGFSLMELVVVIIIIGILSTFGVTQYRAAREQALDREVQANLRLILAAERVFRMEDNNTPPRYTACVQGPAANDCNTVLRLLLPQAADRAWNYQVAWLPANGQTFCAQATRTQLPVRTWRLRSPTVAIPDPQPQTGNCP